MIHQLETFDILLVLMVIAVLSLGVYHIMQCVREKRAEAKWRNQPPGRCVYYRTLRGKRCRYSVCFTIDEKRSEIEHHLERLADDAKTERTDQLVHCVVAQLAAQPRPERGRAFADVVARIAEDIPTVYDHHTSHRRYRADLASFLDQHVLGNAPLDPTSTPLLLSVPEIAANDDVAHDPWVLLTVFLQRTFDVPADSRGRCCCGHHPSNYWPVLRAILLDTPGPPPRMTRMRDIVWPRLPAALRAEIAQPHALREVKTTIKTQE